MSFKQNYGWFHLPRFYVFSVLSILTRLGMPKTLSGRTLGQLRSQTLSSLPNSLGTRMQRSYLGTTGLNNVCACARSHGSRCRQQPGHHNKSRKNGGVFKSFVWCPVYGEKREPDWKREKEIFKLVPSTIGRHIPFCTLEFKACTIGENSA